MLYDDGCKVCTKASGVVRQLDTRGEIEYLGLRASGARELAARLDEEAYWSSFHVVRDGVVRSGPDAFEDLLGILTATKGVRKAMDELPPVRAQARALYELAMRIRGDLQCEHSPARP